MWKKTLTPQSHRNTHHDEFQIDEQNQWEMQSQQLNYNKTPAEMFPLKIYEILVGYSGQCLQKQPSIGNFQKKDRNSHQRCFMKKGVLRNFKKFTGKRLCQSLFLNKVAGLKPATLLKKRLWHRCFPVNFLKFPKTSFLQNTSRRLLLEGF